MLTSFGSNIILSFKKISVKKCGFLKTVKKKLFGPKKYLVKKIGQKIVLRPANGSERIWAQKKVGSKKPLCPKKFWIEKNLCPKYFGSIKMLSPKQFWI